MVNPFQQGQVIAQDLARARQNIDLSEQANIRANEAEARAGEGFTDRQNQQALRNERVAQQDELDIAKNERVQAAQAGRNVVSFFKSALSQNIPLTDIADRAVPALIALGVEEEQIAPLIEQIQQNPGLLDNIDAVLSEEEKPRRVIQTRAVAVKDDKGNPVNRLIKVFSDGSTEFIDDVAPLREQTQQQRVEQGEPDALGRASFSKTVGAAEGKVAAGDLKRGVRETRDAARNVDASEQRFNLVNSNIDTAIDQSNAFTSGFFGSIGSFIPGSPQDNLAKTLSSVESNIGFDELRKIRDSGGTLGQVTERELDLLQSTIAAVKQSQSEEQLDDNLRILKEQMAQSQARIRQAFQEDFIQGTSRNTNELSLDDLLNQVLGEGQ